MDAKFLVPYETAQLLKEKGYEAETDYYYSKETKSITPLRDLKNEWYPDSLQKVIDARYIPAPTYHEVLDWITKKSGYFISTRHATHMAPAAWYCAIDVGGDMDRHTKGYLITREDALNAAILETLKRL